MWTVGAVTGETPLGFMGTGLVLELIVSDSVFDGLSDRMLQLGPTVPGHMTVKSDNPDAAWEPSNGSTRLRLGAISRTTR